LTSVASDTGAEPDASPFGKRTYAAGHATVSSLSGSSKEREPELVVRFVVAMTLVTMIVTLAVVLGA
jgi:hypothetical protein